MDLRSAKYLIKRKDIIFPSIDRGDDDGIQGCDEEGGSRQQWCQRRLYDEVTNDDVLSEYGFVGCFGFVRCLVVVHIGSWW